MKRTAEELVRELSASPEYRATIHEREARAAATAAECRPEDTLLTAEFDAAGVRVASVWELVNSAVPYPELYPILVRHLALPHHRRIREGIIRALTVKDAGREAETALLREFHSESDAELRWTLANALKTVMPYHRRKKHREIHDAFGRAQSA